MEGRIKEVGLYGYILRDSRGVLGRPLDNVFWALIVSW